MLSLAEIAILRSRAEKSGMIVSPWAESLCDTAEQLHHERQEAREMVTALLCNEDNAQQSAHEAARRWFLETTGRRTPK